MCLNAINRWGLELVVQILDKFRISLLEKKNRSLSKTCICIYFSLAKKWGLLNVPDLHLIKMESIQELAKKKSWILNGYCHMGNNSRTFVNVAKCGTIGINASRRSRSSNIFMW